MVTALFDAQGIVWAQRTYGAYLAAPIIGIALVLLIWSFFVVADNVVSNNSSSQRVPEGSVTDIITPILVLGAVAFIIMGCWQTLQALQLVPHLFVYESRGTTFVSKVTGLWGWWGSRIQLTEPTVTVQIWYAPLIGRWGWTKLRFVAGDREMVHRLPGQMSAGSRATMESILDSRGFDVACYEAPGGGPPPSRSMPS